MLRDIIKKFMMPIVITVLVCGMLLIGNLTVMMKKTQTSKISQVKDLKQDHWAAVYISEFIEEGILDMDENGNIYADKEITRAEFIKIYTKAYESSFQTNKINRAIFSDVSPEDWFYPYVVSALNEGLADGINADGTIFGPEETLTREQMITFSGRALKKYKGYDKPDDAAAKRILQKFSDQDSISGYATNWVALHVELGIIAGYAENESGRYDFYPASPVTKAETVKILSLARDAHQ